MFKNILVAIDGSTYSKEAVPVAIEIARKFESTIFVIHVAEHERGRAGAFIVESPAEATMLVADAVKIAHDAGIAAKGELLDRAAGHASNAIAEVSKAAGADLIVMGSRGLSDAQGVFLGSVTHQVIRLVDVPVLVARPRKGAAATAEMAHASVAG